MIRKAVREEMARIEMVVNQSAHIEEITKWQTAKLLGYKTTHTLKNLQSRGLKDTAGNWHTLQPLPSGHYLYAEVLDFKIKCDL